MIIEVDSTQLRENPFNPKNPFQKDEEEILNKSLERWGLRGVFLTCDDYKNNDKFIVIDGNSRYKKIKGKVKIDNISGIENDEQLQMLTMDFCSSVKKRNFAMLNRIYNLHKEKLGNEYKNIYERCKINIDRMKLEQREIREKEFQKNVLLKFKSKTAYEMYQYYLAKTKNYIKENNKKLWIALEQQTENLKIDLIEKYFFDIIFHVEGLNNGSDS